MCSFRCLHGKHTSCSGHVFFGDIKQPQDTWEYLDCKCKCHVQLILNLNHQRRAA